MRKVLVVAVIYDHSKLVTNTFMLLVDSLNLMQIYLISIWYLNHLSSMQVEIFLFLPSITTNYDIIKTADHWIYKQHRQSLSIKSICKKNTWEHRLYEKDD